MRLVSALVAASNARRILEIGCGLGYSALWLAEAAGLEGRVDTIDRFPEHLRLAEQYLGAADFSERVHLLEGEADAVLPRLRGPYDIIYDDGWFVEEPAYLETMLDLLRTGGLLAMANWFPLEDAVLGRRGNDIDWAVFSGPDWADRIQAYARRLASHPKLSLAYALRPWLGLAVKVA